MIAQGILPPTIYLKQTILKGNRNWCNEHIYVLAFVTIVSDFHLKCLNICISIVGINHFDHFYGDVDMKQTCLF